MSTTQAEVAAVPAEGKTAPKKEAKKPQQPQVLARVPVPVNDVSGEFGDLPLIQSTYTTDRKWTELNEINVGRAGEKVWIRARVHTVRGKGKTCFILLRRGLSTLQLTMLAFGNPGDVSVDLVKFAAKIPSESLVDVYGKLVKPAMNESAPASAAGAPETETKVEEKNKVKGATIQDVELSVEKIFIVSASAALPFQITDAARYDPLDKGLENEEANATEGAEGVIRVLQNMRLDNRWLDLRTFANHAIFRLQSRICQYFREYFLEKDFVEIHSPKIIPGVSEGGAQVFKLGYFGQTCCLAQSPQLYKQMGVLSDLFRVFEIGPVFRAEDANTPRHMCEFTGLDFEMEIKEHYHEVLKTLGSLFVYVFDKVNANCKAELDAVNSQYPFTPLAYNRDVLILDFKEARRMINEDGGNMDEFADPSTPQEKQLGRLVKKKYGVDLYIVDKYPLAVRPFYTMPNAQDAKYSNSYDVFLRGEEITSGAQRVHDVAMLTQRAKDCGIPLESISSYIKSFMYGATPHGGAGIGLERVVMLFLGLNNIRKASMFPRLPNRVTP